MLYEVITLADQAVAEHGRDVARTRQGQGFAAQEGGRAEQGRGEQTERGHVAQFFGEVLAGLHLAQEDKEGGVGHGGGEPEGLV